jgi:anti-sigma factor RsiW
MPIGIDEWACRQVLARLDSYIDNELLTETNLEICHHFGRCAACAHEAAERRALRARVQAAVRKTALPDGFEGRLRARLWF